MTNCVANLALELLISLRGTRSLMVNNRLPRMVFEGDFLHDAAAVKRLGIQTHLTIPEIFKFLGVLEYTTKYAAVSSISLTDHLVRSTGYAFLFHTSATLERLDENLPTFPCSICYIDLAKSQTTIAFMTRRVALFRQILTYKIGLAIVFLRLNCVTKSDVTFNERFCLSVNAMLFTEFGIAPS